MVAELGAGGSGDAVNAGRVEVEMQLGVWTRSGVDADPEGLF